MRTLTAADRIAPGSTPKPLFLDGLARRAVLTRLERLQHGKLIIIDADDTSRFGQACDLCPLEVTVNVRDARFYADIAFGGSVGAGEAYIQGYWGASDLTNLVRILIHNRDVLDGMETGLARLTAPVQKILHWLSRNTRAGARRNIAAHYDLGNDFFRLFLDETMMYSCAMFEHAHTSLHAASVAKLERICRKLDLQPTDHLLEIGTGWGGFALHAASRYGCRVTTTTISRQQYELARERIHAAGLRDRITLLLEDYRDLRDAYDKLASIEMIEAIGYDQYDTFFRQCGRLLKPDGQMLLQSITIADQRYQGARDEVDFIKRYVFPGSCIPSITVLNQAMTQASDLKLFHLEDIGPHYATTLRRWRENLHARIDAVRALGYSDAFIRLRGFYLCYCEGGFAERVLGDVHMLLVKPACRRSVEVSTTLGREDINPLVAQHTDQTNKR